MKLMKFLEIFMLGVKFFGRAFFCEPQRVF